ncbi:MAG: IgGFc-binding protein [Chitinophagaceae bacterium]|nr:IgGFc-binding protein [Chitinophagaceae bacterium]
MKTFLRTTLVALFCLATTGLFAQLSDLHYLPPLKQKDGAFVQQTIYVTTPETETFQVYVYRGTSTEPVATLNVSNTSTATYNPGDGNNGITLVSDANTGVVHSNAGLRFESENGKKFYVNWRGRSASQGSSLTSKGRAALGTAFKWVGIPNRGAQLTALSNSLGIMATEDNTVVSIFGYNPNTTFRQGSSEEGLTADDITVTLNKGQTYVLESSVTTANSPNRDGWLGASITSSKPIAVNFGQMHIQPVAGSTSRDAAIDQIIPENTLGKEYVLVRGRGIDGLEFPVVIATQNNTQIFVNGGTTPIATINNGDYYAIPSTYYSQSSTNSSVPGGNLYVRTSKEAYVVQSLAGDVSDATGDVNFIAPINCLLSNTVNNIPDVSVVAGQTISGGITIIASTAIADQDIVVTYGIMQVPTATLTAAKKSVTGNTEWKTYYLAGLTGAVKSECHRANSCWLFRLPKCNWCIRIFFRV